MESLNRALQGFGEKYGIPGIQADANGLCTLRFDEKYVVQIQHDSAANQLVFFTLVGPVPANAKLAAYEALLQANLFWAGTKGATLSVEPQGGSVFLAKAVPVEGFSFEVLEKELQAVVDSAELWAGEMANLEKGIAPAEKPPAPAANVRV